MKSEQPPQPESVANLIYPENLPSAQELFDRYPSRELPEDAMVTRFAPSPTGFLHIGGVLMALISERFARQSSGVFCLRLEDTDQERFVEEAVDIINNGLDYFGLTPDEGPGSTVTGEGGAYGPYEQSNRKELYDVFIKKLLEEGRAYPCFCTKDELEDIRAKQESMGQNFGYYGNWAKWRDADPDEVAQKLRDNVPYVIRFKSLGDPEKVLIVRDLIKGQMNLRENNLDIVLRKNDGLPTYHLAHAVDDRLMGTTHVLRANEWLSSTPLHIELFQALGFQVLPYGHIAPINKFENIDGIQTVRKLSKRKDPEANVQYYEAQGYPAGAVIEYLMNLANSDFEDWRKVNPKQPHTDFRLSFKRLSAGTGPLFDAAKLDDVSRGYISRLSLDEFFTLAYNWAEVYDVEFSRKIAQNPAYWKSVFAIERDSGKRKDIATWQELYSFYSFFDNEYFTPVDMHDLETSLSLEEIRSILEEFKSKLTAIKSSDEFMTFAKDIAIKLGYAESLKQYKASPTEYKGHVGVITQAIRFAVTGRTMTPDLFQVISVLGEDEVSRRLSNF